MRSPRIIISDDGSHTLRVDELDETYHSTFGAKQESEYVFIEHGLKQMTGSGIRILEVGFGTGLNALLTAIQTEMPTHYVALEPFPIKAEIYESLNYASNRGEQSVFYGMHEAPWGEVVQVSSNMTLEKHQVGIEDFTPESIDLVYYDAFGPDAQPEMWNAEIFQSLFEAMNPGGLFVTYCSRGQVKRDMKSAGFEVERLPGPPGKRHILRGVKF